MKNLKYIVYYGTSPFITYIKYKERIYCINIFPSDLKILITRINPNGLPEDFINQMISDKVDFEFDFHIKEHKILFEVDIFNLKTKVFENFHHTNKDLNFIFNV